MPSMSPPIVFALAATLLGVAACSGRSFETGTPDLPLECNAFVAKYESCFKASVPSLPAVAKERAALTRSALEEEARRASAAPSPGDSATRLNALAAKCHDNLQRLAATCGTTRTN
jgi:hypothetical protein